jgi:hypothetical protein
MSSKINSTPSRFLLGILCAANLGISSAASAQETCSLDEVATALDALDCIPDGVYLSVETAVDSIVDRCGDAETVSTCRRCFRRAASRLHPAFKALARAGLFDRSLATGLRAALRAAEDDTCLALDAPPPPDSPDENLPPTLPTPEPSPIAPTFGDPYGYSRPPSALRPW